MWFINDPCVVPGEAICYEIALRRVVNAMFIEKPDLSGRRDSTSHNGLSVVAAKLILPDENVFVGYEEEYSFKSTQNRYRSITRSFGSYV